MDPQLLIDQSTFGGLPAPVWFIELFKWLGFTLHIVPMNLWFAGTITMMWLSVRGGEHGRRCSARLGAQMPIVIALGINFGIVPLLFIQVAWGQVFYPATMLMAWFWLAIIALLIPAYYGIYVYALGQSPAGAAMPPWKRTAGWLAAVLFLLVGFIFANAMSLMENIKDWPRLWQDHSFHGAMVGTALNTGDPRLWPRWLMMFGLALTTTAAWIVIDSAWFAVAETPAYHAWAKRFARKLYLLGAAWFVGIGSWYCFSTWAEPVRQAMFRSPLNIATYLTGAAPVIVLGLLWLQRGPSFSRGLAILVGLAQFVMLGLNAACRQFVQLVEMTPYFDINQQPTAVQWSPLVVFLVSFILGLGLIFWMLRQVWKLPVKTPTLSR